VLIETAEQVRGLFKERERAIVQLSLEGCSIADISAQLDCSERKVYRVLERAARLSAPRRRWPRSSRCSPLVHEVPLRSVAFSLDGAWLGAVIEGGPGPKGGSVELWNQGTGQKITLSSGSD
jgi:DNA-binding CsgD family transcriptional regulator